MTTLSTEAARELGVDALLAKVSNGEGISLTLNGKTVARLLPEVPNDAAVAAEDDGLRQLTKRVGQKAPLEEMLELMHRIREMNGSYGGDISELAREGHKY